MKYIIANWKMNMDKHSIQQWMGNMKKEAAPNCLHCEVIVCPPFPYLYLTSEQEFATGAQNLSSEENGAHTGEVSSSMVKDYAKYCIVGHSERKETREEVRSKVQKALDACLTPIVCFVNNEDGVSLYKDSIILAWEDPQNISSGGIYKAKDPAEVRENIVRIKASLPKEAKVVYGGSVNKDNAAALASIEELDGVLVGNASLDPDHFVEIIKAFAWK
jgi:triosephosphate isomerase (TIM)